MIIKWRTDVSSDSKVWYGTSISTITNQVTNASPINEDVYTWTRSNADSVSTTFAFVAIATHVDSSTPEKDVKMDRREINNDFGYFENRKQINKFENKIVKLIEQKIKK
jgi:hypothetical protein